MRISLPRRINHFILKHRMLLFLCSILFLMVVFPFVHEQYSGYIIIMEICFSVLLIFGVYIVSDNRKILIISICVALLTFVVTWFNVLLQSINLLLAGLILEITFFTITTITIISHVLEYKKVTSDKIYGAICAYLLIGIIWALIYTTIEHAIPNSFAFNTGFSANFHALHSQRFYFVHFIYYSFVTQTTLGYGDITPLSNPARMLSSIEAVIGQLYVAVLIARLVGLHISHTHLLSKR